MKNNQWARLLAYVTGLVNQQLLQQNEYLVAENRILRAHLPTRLRLTDPERSTLAAIGKRLGRKALAQVACVAKPDDLCLVPQTRRPEVRRFQTTLVSRSATSSMPDRGTGGPNGQGEPELGLRPDHRSPFQPWTQTLRSDRGQHPAPARHPACSEAQPEHELEGFHRSAYGRSGWCRLLHRRSAHVRSGNVLRSVLPTS